MGSTCALCAAEMDGGDTCPRCGVLQPGSRLARRMAQRDRRRRIANTVVILVFFVVGAVIFAHVEDPSQRAWHRICVTTGQDDCD